MSDAIANLLAKQFIARRDVKAIQHADGSWSPHTRNGRRDGDRLPWNRGDLNAHLSKERTFGHYLLDEDSNTKLFAFDIDFEKLDPTKPDRKFYWPEFIGESDTALHEFDPREAWSQRSHPSRKWQKLQLKCVAHELLQVITQELDLPCAAAYSGGKGIHVYGFTGLVSAEEAIEGAKIVLDTLGHYEATRGSNFFVDTNKDPIKGYPNLSIEVFPKQSSLQGKDLGNLMRLPLGRNLKSKDPTFFIDMTSPLGEMVPVDPMHALAGNPWKAVGE